MENHLKTLFKCQRMIASKWRIALSEVWRKGKRKRYKVEVKMLANRVQERKIFLLSLTYIEALLVSVFCIPKQMKSQDPSGEQKP